MKTQAFPLAMTGFAIVVAAMGVLPAKAQSSAGANNAIAVPPPPPIASVPAQPLTPPQLTAPPPVITPETPPRPSEASSPTPGYRLVTPSFNDQSAGPGNTNSAEPRWNSGGGGAQPILESNPSPAYPPESKPQHDAAAIVAQPAASGASSAVAQAPEAWLQRGRAVLGVFNKEDGAVSRLAVQVGNSVVIGKLNVSILACVIRPGTVTPDAAVFLSLKNSQQNQSDTDDQAAGVAVAPQMFKGWLLRSEPGASVVGDATDMFRLIGCGSF